jgi:hypothetical protein
MAHISGHGFVLGFSGRGVSLTISPVSRSVQVLPAAFCTEPGGQPPALADPEADADASVEEAARSSATEAEGEADSVGVGQTVSVRRRQPALRILAHDR